MVRAGALVACIAALLNASGSTGRVNEPTVPKQKHSSIGMSSVNALTNVPEPAFNRRYRRAVVSAISSHTNQIMERIKEGNKYFTALTIMWKSEQLSRASKVRIYRKVLRPVVLIGSRIWGKTLTKKEEYLLRQWEQKVLREIFGASVEVGPFTRVLSYHDISKLYGHPDIVIAARRENGMSPKHHIIPGERVAITTYSSKPNGMRKRRPHRVWLDGHGRVIAKP